MSWRWSQASSCGAGNGWSLGYRISGLPALLQSSATEPFKYKLSSYFERYVNVGFPDA